jgi:hypothetical protein
MNNGLHLKELVLSGVLLKFINNKMMEFLVVLCGVGCCWVIGGGVFGVWLG